MARFAAAETMTRPDYSALAGVYGDLGAPPAKRGAVGSGSGGNPDLKPIRSNNYDAGLEWYFAKRSLLSAGVVLHGPAELRRVRQANRNDFIFGSWCPNGAVLPYLLTVPVNAKGRVEGVEFVYQQALTRQLRLHRQLHLCRRQADFVRPDPAATIGSWVHRRTPTTCRDTSRRNSSVPASRTPIVRRSTAAWIATRRSRRTPSARCRRRWATPSMITLGHLRRQNLNNPTLKYYALNQDQPRAFYRNGAQYYLTLRAKF